MLPTMDDRGQGSRSAIYGWLIASGVAAGARACLIAFQDGYFKAGFETLGLTSFARHYAQGFAVALAVFLVARLAWSNTRGTMRFLVALMLLSLTYASVSCQLPELPFHKPGFEGNAAIAAHVVLALVAIVATLFALALPPRRGRVSLCLSWTPLALAILIVPIAHFVRPQAAEWPTRPNVILISLDTLRTDRLSCYGYERNTTPHIDRFAARGLRLTSANAPHPWTLSSHMSMFTGLLPSEHAVSENKRLSSQIPTLAELYEGAGYDTLAVLDSVVWLDARYGFERGFASYRRVHGSAAEKVAMLDTVFDDLNGGPFFLFLHFFDAHSDKSDLPYESSMQDFAELCAWYTGTFTGCGDTGLCASKLLMSLNRKELDIDSETERYIADMYDAGVTTMDRTLGTLFDELEERGLFENSIVVLTSDHGEELRDHGQYLHGTHYQECISVPLIFRVPNQSEAQTSDVLVSHVDLAPTLLDLCGLDSSLVGGRSYAPLVSRGVDTKRRNHVFFDAANGALGARLGDWKLIHEAGETRFFNLAQDPNELENRIDATPAPKELAELRSLIAIELARLNSLTQSRTSEDRDVGLSGEELRELGNVGYAGDD